MSILYFFWVLVLFFFFFFFQAEDGIRDHCVTGVQTCALPILSPAPAGVTCTTGATRTCSVNVLTMAAGAGLISTLDPTVNTLFGSIRSAATEIGRASCRERV